MSFVYDLYVDNNLDVKGNLNVYGTTTTVNTENLNVLDNNIYLNNNYIGTTSKKGGIVINSKIIDTADQTDTTVSFVAPSTINTVGSGTFQANQKILISGTGSNNGVFTVVSHIGTVITVVEASIVNETIAIVISLLSNITDTTTQFTSNNTITTVGSGTFITGQKIKISGSSSNNGIFTVASHSGTTLTTVETTVITETVASRINLLSDGIDTAGFTSSTQVQTLGTTSFSKNDLIQISSTANPFTGEIANLGIFQVDTHVGQTLTISTVSDFAQKTFIVSTASLSEIIISRVYVTLLQSDTGGSWTTSLGSTSTGITNNLKTILLSGDPTTNASLTLISTNNQIILDPTGGTYATTINVSEPSLQNVVISMPDVSATVSSANFLLSEGINLLGTNTGGSAATYTVHSTASLRFNDTDNSHYFELSFPSNATANRTLSIPTNLDASDEFLFKDHTQTISNKTNLASLGTASNPSYSFIGNINDGFYHDGGNSVNLAIDGTNVLAVTTTGLTVTGTTHSASYIEGVSDFVVATVNLTIASNTINTVNFVGTATVNLPSAPNDGIKFTIINLSPINNDVVIVCGGSDTIENDTMTSITLKRKWQRVTVQYTNVNTTWYIV